MSLIDIKDKYKLFSAKEVRAVASTALIDQELASIAEQINTAANCGSYKCTINHAIQQENVKTLESQGYSVNVVKGSACTLTEISFDKSKE